MLLHIYAAPMTHINKGHAGQLSRPDKNALATLFLPLLQVLPTIFYAVVWTNTVYLSSQLCILWALANAGHDIA